MIVMVRVTMMTLLLTAVSACTSGGAGPRIPAADSEDTGSRKRNSREEPINRIDLDISGLTEDEFREGRLFVNGWTGAEDEPDSEKSWRTESAGSGKYKGKTRISLAHPYDKANEDYEILLATSLTTKIMGVCVADEAPVCEEGESGFHRANLIFASGKMLFFKTENSALLEDGLVLNILSFDESKEIVDRRDIRFSKSN